MLVRSSMLSLVMILVLAGLAEPAIRYVDDNASDGGDGLNWTTAYNDLQDALADAAASGGAVDEIRVAAGTYRPAAPGGDRAATFELLNGVAIKGGHAGLSIPQDPDQRDIDNFTTTLSGDLNSDDGLDFSNSDENSYHVLVAGCVNETAVLDGFTITAGNGNRGAGMVNSGRPTLINCTFRRNRATYNGGAIYNWDRSGPVMFRCVFSENSADNDGGAIYNHMCSMVLVACRFSNNSAGACGGAMQNFKSSVQLINCIISDNAADRYGGAVFDSSGILSLICCTFSGNSAARYGGIRNYNNQLIMANCIFWKNSDDRGTDQSAQIGDGYSSLSVKYSCVQGWTGILEGEGNIDADPLFAQPGYWDDNGTGDNESDDFGVAGDYHLLPGSPCIDAGDNTPVPKDITTDLDGGPRFVDDPLTVDSGNGTPPIVDMGAYEFFRVFLDIKPGSCPNPLNIKSTGKLPVTVLGSEDFDVTTIDPATIVLTGEGQAGGVAPIRWDYEDVGTPFESQECDCHDLDGDGYLDLALKFNTPELVKTLGLDQLARDTILPLILTGNLTEDNGGIPIGGQDCIRILRPPVGDMNNDLRVDWSDFSIFSSQWNQSNCKAPKWCAGADLSHSGKVNWEDFAILAGHWLECTAPECD